MSTWDNHHSRLLPTPTQPKKGTFWNILSKARTNIYSRMRLQQQTHCMGLMFKNNERQRIRKGNPRDTLFISINWNTNILAYWRKQNPGYTIFLCNQWNQLNIHRHTIKLLVNLGPFSNKSNIKHTAICYIAISNIQQPYISVSVSCDTKEYQYTFCTASYRRSQNHTEVTDWHLPNWHSSYGLSAVSEHVITGKFLQW